MKSRPASSFCVVVIAILAVGVGSWADDAASGHLRALIVGISDYGPGWCQLKGDRDAATFGDMLERRFRVDPARIRTIGQKEATRANIEAALTQLAQESQPGDTVVFMYAGHGGVVPDETGLDPDGLNECIIPVDAPDFKDPSFPQRVVRDKFMADTMSAILARVRVGGAQGSVHFIFDSCHAGGMARAGGQRKVRTNPAIMDYFLAQTKRTTLKGSRAVMRPSKGSPEGWVFLAACRADEQANDGPSFTDILVASMGDSRLDSSSNYCDLMQLIGANGQAVSIGQNPQVEGDRHLAILGGATRPGQPAIQVTRVEEVPGCVLLTLDKGTLLGVTPGSVITLYRFGTRGPAEIANRLGEAVVETDDTNYCQAMATVKGKIPVADLRNAVGWVTRQSLAGNQIKLFLAGSLPTDGPYSALRARLAQESLKDLVQLVPTAKNADLVLFARSGQVSLERSSGNAVLARNASDSTTADALENALRKEARRIFLLRLVTADESVTLELVPGRFKSRDVASFAPDGGSPRAARDQHLGQDSLLTFKSGETAMAEITNHGNLALYVALLNLTADGDLRVHYPSEEEMANYRKLRPGDTVKIDVTFDAPSHKAGTESLEGFKVVATTEPLELSILRNRPKPARPGSVGEVLAALFAGTATRGAQPPTGAAGSDEGCVLTRTTWIRVTP